MEISAILERVMKSNPETKADLSVASEICKNRLIGTL